MIETKHRPLSKKKFDSILEKIPHIKIGLIGDGCIDVYWQADMTKSEISKETPHFPLPIVDERFSLGAAGNVAANLKSLGIKDVHFVTCVGEDWRKDVFIQQLELIEIKKDNIILDKKRITPAYCKALRRGISNVIYEDPRIDFENFCEISSETEEKIINQIHALSKKCDVLVVSDQFAFGCITKTVRSVLSDIAREKTVIVDSRNNIGLFNNVIVKPNELESGKLLDMIVMKSNLNEAAIKLYEKTNQSSIITLGAEGAVWIEKKSYVLIPAREVDPPIDIVGAGDAFLAGFSAAFAAGCTGEEAVSFANLVSSITIKKLNTTGTATSIELKEQFYR